MANNLNLEWACHSVNYTDKDVGVLAEACADKLREVRHWPHKVRPAKKKKGHVEGGSMNVRNLLNWIDSVGKGDHADIAKLKKLHATCARKAGL